MALPLLELGPLILYGIGLALCLAVVYFSKAFFGVAGTVLGKLPIVGGWISATGHHIEQRISNVFGDLAARFEARVGASWHAMARMVDRIGHELASHAALLALLADLTTHNLSLRDFGRLWAYLNRYVRAVGNQAAGIGHDVVGRIHAVERGIGADVLPRTKALEREVRRDIGRERARARAAERATKREITHLWKWTKTNALRAGTRPFYLAVAAALTWLGLDWIKCGNWKKVGRGVCGTPAGEIDALLGLFAAGATIASFRQLVELGQQVEHGVAATLQEVAKL